MAHNATLTNDDNTVVINVIQIVVFTVSLLGIFLNITTIMALVHLPWSSRPNLRLMLSLCAANLLFSGNFLVYMVAVYSNPQGNGYAITCLSFEVLRSVIYLYLYLNLFSIIVDLYLAITNPHGYASIVTITRTHKLLIIITVLSVVTVLMALTFNYLTITATTNVYTHESSCSVYSTYMYIRSLNWIFKVTVFVSIPVFIVLLIIIFLAVKATNSSTNAQPSNTRDVVTVLMVVVMFLVCFGPYQFISFYMQHSPDSYQSFSTVAKIFERMFYLYGFFTPLIYSLRMADVKKGYTLMFKNASPPPRITKVCLPAINPLPNAKFSTVSKSLQTTILTVMKLKNNLLIRQKKLWENGNCSLRAISPFPTMLSRVVCNKLV